VQDRKGSANQRLKGRGDEIVDRNGKRYALVKRFFSEVRVKIIRSIKIAEVTNLVTIW